MKKLLLAFCLFSTAYTFGAPVFDPWLGDEKLFKAIPSYEVISFRKYAEGQKTSTQSNHLHLLNFTMQVALNSKWEMLVQGQAAQSNDWGLKVSEGILAARYQLSSDIVGAFLSSAINLSITIPNRGLLNDPQLLYHGDADGELSLSLGKEYTKGKYWLFKCWGFLGAGMANDSKPWAHVALGIKYNLNSYFHFYLTGDGYHTFSKNDLNLANFKGYGQVGQESCDLFLGCDWLQDYYGYLSASIGKRLYGKNGPKDNIIGKLAYTIPFSL